MANTTAQSTPPQQVDQLIQMVADEAGLTIAGQLDGAGSTGSQLPSPNPIQEAPVKKEDDLEGSWGAGERAPTARSLRVVDETPMTHGCVPD